MKSFIRLALASAALSSALLSPAMAQDAPLRIGYISGERILRESNTAKAAQAKLEAEFSKRQKDLQDAAAKLKPLYDNLEKNAAVMSDADRQRRQKEIADQEKELQRRQRELTEDANQRRNEEFTAVVERANKVIRQVAEQDKLDLVVQDAVYASPRLDITDRVLKVLNAQGSGAGTAAPSGK